jgi:hypothetical protein
MAQPTKSAQIAVREAQHKIFIKLCIAYRRSRQDPEFDMRVDDLRRELAIAENVLAEALATFEDANAEMMIEVYDFYIMETSGDKNAVQCHFSDTIILNL